MNLIPNPVFTLAHSVKVYVPSTLNVSENADSSLVSALVTYVATTLATLFGGATEYPAIGSYVANDGTLVRESVTVVQAFISEDNFTRANISKVLTLAEHLCLGMTQECIGVEVDGKFYLVDLSPQKTLQLQLA